MASLMRRFSAAERNKPSRASSSQQQQQPGTSDAIGAPTVEMSMNNGEDAMQATSDSFWEVGKFIRTVKRIDNGYSLCSSLKQLINTRAEIERSYSKQLTQWSKKWNEFLDKGPEYGTTQATWRAVLYEADKVADLHTDVADKLTNEVTVSIKTWQKENYHKSMMHFKETKEMDDAFKKVQKPWEKKLNKVLNSKKDYHNACRNEKSTANQENNARADTAMSSDQLKKLQDKLKKCQQDVEVSQEKYNACLTDLNGYNAKYIEEMNEVFDKCQAFEKRRIDFFKKIMFDIHSCLDLSVNPKYSDVYTELHQSICNTSADKDLQWWSQNMGADMPMAWPVFEEYSPDLKPIHGKEGKKSQVSSTEGGITITSIKHNQDHFVPSSGGSGGSTNNRQASNRDSQLSSKSQTSNNSYSYSNPASDPAPVPTPPTNPARQVSYDEALNPFGDDDAHLGENVNGNAITNDEHKTIDNTEPSGSGGNPFGDDSSDHDEQQSQGSGAGMSDLSGGTSVSVPIRVIYTYKAEEEDEISAEQGDVLTRLSDQDDMGWVKARSKDGREGLIPYGYVEDI